MPPGTGPRHLAFHPSGRYVYVLGELSATLTACSFDPETGVLKILHTEGIVPEDFDGNRQSAAVRVSADGKYVYASNRSEVSNLAVFSVAEDGSLKRIQVVDGVPYWPRDFDLTPDGKYLLVAGARVDLIEAYRIDPETGELSETGITLRVPSPISIVFTR
jgi:6-phosphogluconolactonase